MSIALRPAKKKLNQDKAGNVSSIESLVAHWFSLLHATNIISLSNIMKVSF